MYVRRYIFVYITYYEFEIYVRGTLVEISGNLRKSRGNLEEIWVSRTIDLKFVVPSKVVYTEGTCEAQDSGMNIKTGYFNVDQGYK